ncbi:MAG: cellulose binding domain-containing protein [Verrucomicrobiota bacterium]
MKQQIKQWLVGLVGLAALSATQAHAQSNQIDGPTPVEITWSKASDWGGGFVANLKIKNTGSQPIQGWRLGLELPARQVVNIWNAKVVSNDGSTLTVENMSYNRTIAPGQEISFGFQATPGNANAPAAYVFNGTPSGGGSGPGPDPEPDPRASIADVAVDEGTGNGAVAVFTVTLDAPADDPVRIDYATSNGTARAGEDYLAASGTLLIPAGQSSGRISVQVVGDTADELDETAVLNLSNPRNAELADNAAVLTIRDDDEPAPPVLPLLTVGNASAVEASAGASGFFSTSGNQIVDRNGNVVRIAGVNWFGMESDNFSPHGTWTRSYKEMMDQMVELGFNTIRLPFCLQAFDPGSSIKGVDFAANPEWVGKRPIEVMDSVVEYAAEIGLRIILDCHRSNAGPGPNSNGLWYTSAYPETRWISDWVMLAERYRGQPAVIGADLANEPHNGQWGGGGARDWPAAAERAARAIHQVNPDWLIFVEGVGGYNGESYWWGGALAGVRDRPVQLTVPNKLVYSPHAYPNSVFSQAWFSAPDFPQNLYGIWNRWWGFIYEEEIAPIMLGEFGSRFEDPKDLQWFAEMEKYLRGDLDGDGTNDVPAGRQPISWTYWSWNPNSGDTGGILKDDWRSVHQNKVDLLRPAMFALPKVGDATGGGAPVAGTVRFPVNLNQATTREVSVDYATGAGSATPGADFEPAQGTLRIPAGETGGVIEVALLDDDQTEAEETFALNLGNAQNAQLATASATGTIVDDEGNPAPAPDPQPDPGPDPQPDPDPDPQPDPQPDPGAGLQASFVPANQWGSGFIGNITITNNTTQNVDNWELSFELPRAIQDHWGGQITGRNGNTYTVGPESWNRQIAPGQSVTFGFKADPGQPGEVSLVQAEAK